MYETLASPSRLYLDFIWFPAWLTYALIDVTEAPKPTFELPLIVVLPLS